MFFSSRTALLLGGLVTSVLQPVKAAQYCMIDPDRGVDACVGISSFANHTTGNTDLYLVISALFHPPQGWAGLGTGGKMDDSLMFLIYPGDEYGDVTMSVRTTTVHHQPHETDDTPEIYLLNSFVDDRNHYHTAEIVCFSCNTWQGNPITNDVNVQQEWIWSTNQHGITGTSNTSALLTRHTNYDMFFADMKNSHVTKGVPVLPYVSNERLQSDDIHQGSPVELIPSKHRAKFVVAHGLFAALGALLFSAGIVLIKLPGGKAFKNHRNVQILATVVFFIGAILGLALSFRNPTFKNFVTAHQIVGLLLSVSVPAQIFLGYKHHLNYLKVGRRTPVSYGHILLGRSTWMLMSFNVFLGFELANPHSMLEFKYALLVLSLAPTLGVIVLFAMDLRARDEFAYETLALAERVNVYKNDGERLLESDSSEGSRSGLDRKSEEAVFIVGEDREMDGDVKGIRL